MRFQPDIYGVIAVAYDVATIIYRIVTGDPIFCPAATHDPKNNGSVLLIRNGRHRKIAGVVLVKDSDWSLTDDL